MASLISLESSAAASWNEAAHARGPLNVVLCGEARALLESCAELRAGALSIEEDKAVIPYWRAALLVLGLTGLNAVHANALAKTQVWKVAVDLEACSATLQHVLTSSAWFLPSDVTFAELVAILDAEFGETDFEYVYSVKIHR